MDPKATIDQLCDDLKPVRPLTTPALRMLGMGLAILGYMAVCALVIGLRPDLAARFADSLFVLEIALAGLLFGSALYSSSLIMVPDAQGRSWVFVIPLSLLALFVLWSCIRGVDEGMHAHLHEMWFWHECVSKSIVFATLPVGFMAFVSSHGASTRPVLSVALNVLAVSGAGFVALRLTCADDSIAHHWVHHVLPYVVIGALAGLVLRRFYRW